jgi:hypothetical protein
MLMENVKRALSYLQQELDSVDPRENLIYSSIEGLNFLVTLQEKPNRSMLVSEAEDCIEKVRGKYKIGASAARILLAYAERGFICTSGPAVSLTEKGDLFIDLFELNKTEEKSQAPQAT